MLKWSFSYDNENWQVPGCLSNFRVTCQHLTYISRLWYLTLCEMLWWDPGGGGTRSENWWGCAAGRWKLDPKRSREKWNLGPKRSNSLRIGSFNTPKDRFGVGGWEKIPQKDRARSCQSEKKRGSKPRHICITHHIGSTPPPGVRHLTLVQLIWRSAACRFHLWVANLQMSFSDLILKLTRIRGCINSQVPL